MNRREALRLTTSLSGMALSSSMVVAFMNSCQPNGNPAEAGSLLTPEEKSLIAAMAEVIIPKTDTPGARDVGVPDFIRLMLRDGLSTEDQQTYRRQLSDFSKKIIKDYGHPFEQCSPEEQNLIISAEEEQSFDQQKVQKIHFYSLTKQLTLLGFFTSKKVMTTMLDYHGVPGRYEGCIPFDENGRLFVDNNV